MSGTHGEAPSSTEIVLRLNEETGCLQALCPPGAGRLLAAAELKERIAAEGYGDWYLLEGELQGFVAAVRDSDDAVLRDVAECRDAEVRVDVARDEMQVTLTLVPARGGKPADEAEVRRALEEQGVTHGILWGEIRAALEAGGADGRVIAQGEPPEHGRDARFACLLRASGGQIPKIDDRGRADFHDLDTFLTVDPGDYLMRRVPATPGRSGRNVHGQIIPPDPGKDSGFSGGLKGARLAEDDANLLIAECGGLPTVFPQGVRVDPVITVETIDMSTGNLDFDGVVNIRGDVLTGLRVEATGDIFVAGTVEGAEIVTPRDVEVRGSIIGQGNVRDAEGRVGANAARIRCGGSVRARVISNALVEAGGSVLVTNEIAHSEVVAQHQVAVGRRGADKAQIVGGEIRATEAIKAALLGSPAGVRTHLCVGHDPAVQRASQELKAHVEAKQAQRNELTKGLQHLLKKEAADRADKVRQALEQIMQEIRELEREQAGLQAKLDAAADACIVASRRLFANVELVIAGHSSWIRDEHSGGVFYLQDGKIVLK